MFHPCSVLRAPALLANSIARWEGSSPGDSPKWSLVLLVGLQYTTKSESSMAMDWFLSQYFMLFSCGDEPNTALSQHLHHGTLRLTWTALPEHIIVPTQHLHHGTLHSSGQLPPPGPLAPSVGCFPVLKTIPPLLSPLKILRHAVPTQGLESSTALRLLPKVTRA